MAAGSLDAETMTVYWVMVIVVVTIFIIILYKSIRIVRPDQEGVLLVLGRQTRTLHQGLHLLPPFISRVEMVEVGYQPIDLPGRDFRTSENLRVEIDVFFILDVEESPKAALRVSDYKRASMHAVEVALAALVMATPLPDLMRMHPDVTEDIRKDLDKATLPFGVVIQKVDMRDIRPDDQGRRFLRELASMGPSGTVRAPVPDPGSSSHSHKAGIWVDQREGELARVRRALDTLPAGLPQSLWGWQVDELAVAVVDGNRRTASTGATLVEIDGIWYMADPDDIALFLKEWRGD
jgi:hypothetical protein